MEKVKSSEKIISRMKELGKLLNEASRAYYQESRELMPNLEYDRLYDELASLERESGIVLSGSPTTTVGYEVLSALPKEAHPEKMLSLDKTKDKEELAQWLGQKTGVLSWKLDGLTIVLTYEEKLSRAETAKSGKWSRQMFDALKMFRWKLHTRASWCFAAKPLSAILILRN